MNTNKKEMNFPSTEDIKWFLDDTKDYLKENMWYLFHYGYQYGKIRFCIMDTLETFFSRSYCYLYLRFIYEPHKSNIH